MSTELRTRDFLERDSYFSQLFKCTEVQSAFNLITSCIIYVFLTLAINYFQDSKMFQSDLSYLTWSFGTLPIVLAIDSLLHLALLLVFFPMTIEWIVRRSKGEGNGMFYLNWAALISLMVYTSLEIMRRYGLTPPMRMAVVSEQLRLVMKMISFVIENYKQILRVNDAGSNPSNGTNGTNGTKDRDKSKLQIPTLYQFVYFLFAPTLLYRHEYPRSKRSSVNWTQFWAYAIQVLIAILAVAALNKHVLVPAFENVGLEPYPLSRIINMGLTCALFGVLYMIMLCYGFLHCWMNLWAELLLFGDRKFYEDWWNSTNYGMYYRKWNIVVNDFIYAYVYSNIVKTTGGNKSISALIVFVTSAILHDYVMSVGFGFFYPVFMATYGVAGVSFFFIHHWAKAAGVGHSMSHYVGNFIFFFTVFIGWSVLISLYTLEWYSRVNCPKGSETLSDLWMPRSFSCIQIISY